MAAAWLGVLVVCGVLVANRMVLGTDVAVFRRVNHWPGGSIRRCGRSLLKVWLEAVAKMVVQRGRPAETLPDVILRGQSGPTG